MIKVTLKLVRMARGLTQQDVAKELNININMYRRIERNPYNAKVSELIKVCNFLKVDINDIVWQYMEAI